MSERSDLDACTARWEAIGTTVTVIVVDAADLPSAAAAVRYTIERFDETCSRFRSDSELVRLSASGGRPALVSPLLLDAVEAALRAARLTDGAVDPTGGAAIRSLGYDDDFRTVAGRDGSTPGDGCVSIPPFPGWQLIKVDRKAGTVCLPAGVDLDLGATAKGLAADRAADRACAAIAGRGVLVSLGGDISVRGVGPDGGWPIRVADDHRVDPTSAGPCIDLSDGGVATSSTTVRQWHAGGEERHHILDPASGAPARSSWRTVTVAAGTCLDANIASTAAVVKGEAGLAWLELHRLPARLVRHDGSVARVSGWPDDPREVA